MIICLILDLLNLIIKAGAMKTKSTKKRKDTGSKGGSGPSVCKSFNRALDIAAEKQKKANEAYKEKINSIAKE